MPRTTDEQFATVEEWDEFGQGYIDGKCVSCICGEWLGEGGTPPSEHFCPADEHNGESQCVECGEWKADPDEFHDGLRCKICAGE